MTANGWLQILLFSVSILAVTRPLGTYMHRVFEGHAQPLPRFFGPIERVLYRLCGVDPTREQEWTSYTLALLVFSAMGALVTYALQRLQGVLPLNPQGFGPVSPDSSFNTAVSFTTNTNWQGYSGESTMSYLTQMAGLAWHNFTSAAAGIAVALVLARGLTRSLVAMRAEEGSTRTVGCILIQMIMSMTSQSGTMDRVLNAPTSDAWITPWVNHLQNKGVKLFLKSTADSFQFDGTRITGVVVQGPNGQATVTGDHYLAAFPVEVAQKKLSPLGKPSLANLLDLKYESMNGLQFYLTRDVPCCHGHIICANSPWAVTCISQPQFWSGINMGQYGDGTIRGLISVDISDWTQPGNKTTPKTANQCTEAEIVAETWAQVMAHLASTSSPLQNGDLKAHYLDPSVIPTVGNTQPLLVNTKGSWVKRPTAATEIPNLFLASDYVQTNTDLATMEGANEAARRAVNEILKASNSSAQPCGVWPFREPAIFDPLKQLDEWLFDLNLPHPGFRTLKNTSSVTNFLGF